MEELDIRYSTLEDKKFLMKWLNNPDDLKYYPMAEGKELEDAVNNWIGFSRYKSSLTATLKDVPVGIVTLYLMPYKKVAHLSMFYLIVDQNHRRKGVGKALVKNILNLAEKYFSMESIYAEVFEGSAVIDLFEKLGFTSFAKQEHFIKDMGKYRSRIHYEYVF